MLLLGHGDLFCVLHMLFASNVCTACPQIVVLTCCFVTAVVMSVCENEVKAV